MQVPSAKPEEPGNYQWSPVRAPGCSSWCHQLLFLYISLDQVIPWDSTISAAQGPSALLFRETSSVQTYFLSLEFHFEASNYLTTLGSETLGIQIPCSILPFSPRAFVYVISPFSSW
jgi:hypothetical protein